MLKSCAVGGGGGRSSAGVGGIRYLVMDAIYARPFSTDDSGRYPLARVDKERGNDRNRRIRRTGRIMPRMNTLTCPGKHPAHRRVATRVLGSLANSRNFPKSI